MPKRAPKPEPARVFPSDRKPCRRHTWIRWQGRTVACGVCGVEREPKR